MTSEPSGEQSKALVQKWLAGGLSSPEGLAMVTDDFRWMAPASMVDLFEGGEAVLHGREGLAQIPFLDHALYADYSQGDSAANVHFMIAEGDRVVMQFDAAYTTHDGERYHNVYSITFRVRDDKICEVWEHADTHYSHQVCMGTEEKRAGVLARLAEMRAGAGT